MPRSLPTFSACLIAILLAGMPSKVLSQASRFFVEGLVGTSLYSGERSYSYFDTSKNVRENFGPSASLGIGFSLSPVFDMVGSFSFSTYSNLENYRIEYPRIIPSTTSTRHLAVSGALRYRFFTKLAIEPFVTAGLGITGGRLNSEIAVAFGPMIGLGIARTYYGVRFVAAATQHYVIPGRAIDLAGSNKSPDVLSGLNLGIQYRFKGPKPRMSQILVAGPHTLNTGAEGVFTASTELDPYEYTVTWSFGDGSVQTGYSVRHSYATPGDYTVNVTVANERSVSKASMDVMVSETFDRVSLVSMSVVPTLPKIGETVTFRPVIRGNEVSCSWSFGDGGQSNSCDTEHVYSNSGVFRVVLTASNVDHSAHSSQALMVQADACTQLPELLPVFFRANSTELTLEMRQLLRDNMATASACVERVIEVVGYALDSERNASALANERGAQVYQYYRNLGISSARVRSAEAQVISSEALEELSWTVRKASSALVQQGN